MAQQNAESPTRRESYNPLLKGYPDSRKINAVSEGAEILYVRLIAASDDAGHYPANPHWVLGKLFTQRMANGEVGPSQIYQRTIELWRIDLIRLYEVEGEAYLELVNVFKRVRRDCRTLVFCPPPVTETVPWSERTRLGFVDTDPATDLATELDPDQSDHKCALQEIQEKTFHLLRKVRYDGNDGAIFWQAAALARLRVIPPAAIWDAAEACRACRPKNVPAYFRTVLADNLVAHGVDLAPALARLRIEPPPPTCRPEQERDSFLDSLPKPKVKG